MSEKLNHARKYEEKYEKLIRPEMRPAFHLSPRVGWMNDPNGFSIYKGRYHMFYQYHPYESKWGPMHWGHAVSSDLLYWEYLPAAIAPDMPYDEAGCFSGSAIELDDGRQLLMYTGVRREKDPDGREHDVQTQCLAVGDGIDYTKYEGNPVLTENDLPEGASRIDFRDPHIWREPDGTYLAVTGNRASNGLGQLLLFESPDAFHWHFKSTMEVNNGQYGRMWECPDFFRMDGQDFVIMSPQDLLPVGLDIPSGNITLCQMGKFDPSAGTFEEEKSQAIDFGIDFYAPQTIQTPDGRRVMIGWMQNWDACSIRPEEEPWAGQMSLPRELSWKNNRLVQKPVRELAGYRKNKVSYRNLKVSGEPLYLEGMKGRTVDMEVSVRPDALEDIFHSVTIGLAAGGPFHTDVTFRPWEETLAVDRNYSGSRRAILHKRKCHIENGSAGKISLRIIIDRYSVEVFTADGTRAMSAEIFTDLSADRIYLQAKGTAVVDIDRYELVLD